MQCPRCRRLMTFNRIGSNLTVDCEKQDGTWYKCIPCAQYAFQPNSPNDPECSICREKHPSDDRHSSE